MNIRERGFLAAILAAIVLMVGFDLATDSTQGVKWWHLAAEGTTALAAAVGLFYLVRASFTLRRSLEIEKRNSSQLEIEAERWRTRTKKYLDGLSRSIDAQLSTWKLTGSEKEIAFLLLKGLSSKEIAEIRETNEKTVRTQAASIYSKAGLNGRSELSAFFLEDLLLPSRDETEMNEREAGRES